MIKLALIGYGKMGKAIEKIVEEKYSEKLQVLYKIDEHSTHLLLPETLSKADVAIEFTTPNTAVSNILKCFEAQVPVVVGTTGWYEDYDRIYQICIEGNHSLFHATNFSIGVNIFFQLNQYLSKIMQHYSNYKPQITEIHHTEKKDAPSGTAITLAEGLMKNNPFFHKWVNHNMPEKTELSIVSKRIEGVPGTHEVAYHSEIDTINIEHIAHSRNGFADGAIQAALFLHAKKGVYQMNDLLSF